MSSVSIDSIRREVLSVLQDRRDELERGFIPIEPRMLQLLEDVETDDDLMLLVASKLGVIERLLYVD